jgi:hypothetical protein
MLNDFVTAPCSKRPVGILSLLRMPFRQGALGLVFQVVFQVFLGTFRGERRNIGHG